MNLNNKGFAISSIMYIILVLAIILISLTLAVFSSRKLILDNQKNDALHEIYQSKFKNGDIVYFNVETGKKCLETDYNELNSNTGYNGIDNRLETQNGCLKFYAFNDDGGNSVNLLLDHNTTATVAWDLSGSNLEGPKEVIDKLKTDTKDWKGTLTPLNYSVNQGEGYANYEIDYSGYNARLITASEIARITGNTTFNIETISSDGYFYFDTNTGTQSLTCKSEDTSGCNYRWLYDRTNPSCTTYGCLNNADTTTYGYWTGTSVAGVTLIAWSVDHSGSLGIDGVDISYYYGLRPVITVLREKLL